MLDIWTNAQGRYVDPFRPQIEPDGFESPEALREDGERMWLPCGAESFAMKKRSTRSKVL